MSTHPQKGVIILSMARSGSSWLGSLANATKEMGDSQEWLSNNNIEDRAAKASADVLYTSVMKSASTENKRFSIKVFPQHIVDTTLHYKTDIISRIRAEHDAKFLLLTRQDRVGQAISTLRAAQTGSWNSEIRGDKSEQHHPIRYNFRKLCRAYFLIGRGYDFCQSYLSVLGLPYEAFTYEDMQESPTPYLQAIADHMEVPLPESQVSPLKKQRDEETEIWRARFHEDIAKKGVHPAVFHNNNPAPTLLNASRVLFGNPTLPVPGGRFF